MTIYQVSSQFKEATYESLVRNHSKIPMTSLTDVEW